MVINTKGYRRLTADKVCTQGCLNLVEGFLSYLGWDFRNAMENFLKDKKDETAYKYYMTLRDLMLSEYFHLLTGLDGAGVVESLERDIVKRLKEQGYCA